MIRRLLIIALFALVLLQAPVGAATLRGVASFEERSSGQSNHHHHRLLQEIDPGTCEVACLL